MKRALALSAVLAAAPAAAQPVTRPDTCGASIAYAPDDVRDTVESWLRQEPHCAVTLEVRIVPTEGGLYLFARDESGRVRERVVPDAEAAAVLVTSWMADDAQRPEPVPAPLPVFERPRPTAPASVEASDASHERPSRRPPGRWIGIGPVLGAHARGARAELDAVRWGAWAVGAAAAAVESHPFMDPFDSIPMQSMVREGPMNVLETSGLAYITRVTRFGDWYVRPAVGVGFMYTRTQIPMSDRRDPWNPIEYTIDDEALRPMVEASLLLGFHIGDNWQLDAGPRVTRAGQGPGDLHRTAERTVFAALRYRL